MDTRCSSRRTCCKCVKEIATEIPRVSLKSILNHAKRNKRSIVRCQRWSKFFLGLGGSGVTSALVREIMLRVNKGNDRDLIWWCVSSWLRSFITNEIIRHEWNVWLQKTSCIKHADWLAARQSWLDSFKESQQDSLRTGEGKENVKIMLANLKDKKTNERFRFLRKQKLTFSRFIQRKVQKKQDWIKWCQK